MTQAEARIGQQKWCRVSASRESEERYFAEQAARHFGQPGESQAQELVSRNDAEDRMPSTSLPVDQPALQRTNILLVDEQLSNLLVLRAALESLGQNLMSAHSKEKALALLLHDDFSVLLLDMQMSGLGGFDLARLIRAQERSRRTPIIFLATYEPERDQLEEAYELGAVDFLVKPLIPVILRAKVAIFVDLFQQTEQVRHHAFRAAENAGHLSTLQEIDRRKDEFLAMLAHELRNPLAPIRNAVQILRVKAPPVPELQWASELIDRQVQQMARLVDDLLDVSRIATGKIELRKERVPLMTVATSAIEASRPLIEKWGHQLTVTLPPEPIYLDADPIRLSQVLLNLLNNAAKYTDQGGRIGLTAELRGQSVHLHITDTGIGILPESLPTIFQMFTQVDRSLERSQGGLGIGLTLVQRLVELHGGSVEARSDGPGMGSEFIVRLPIAAEVAGQLASSDPHKSVTPAKCRILVVDDNQDAADSLAMLLRMTGNEVNTAHDGLEAVGAAAVFRPDMVLLDIGLPKLNGYEVGRRIREQLGAEVALIALTGWGQEEDRRRSRDAGFDHHMSKPVEFNTLQDLLAELKGPHRGT